MRHLSPWVTLAALLPAASVAATVPARTERGVGHPGLAYRIEAHVDPATGIIEGSEHVAWANQTATPTAELQWHLYLNGFAGERATWMREGRIRRAPTDARAFGAQQIVEVRGPGGEDWSSRLTFIAPDDGNADDRTVARLALPQPVPPGATIAVDLRFRAQLPGFWARTGHVGNFIAGAQWFPKLGVFEPPRDQRTAEARWNAHQFHQSTEFYADFADYEVALTLPEAYRGKIAATGVAGAPIAAVQPGWFTVTYRATPVHDFAFFADPDFVVVRRTFRGAEHRDAADERRWLDIFRGDVVPAQMLLPDVEVELFLQPEHVELADRHFAAIDAGLTWFGRAFGGYPYPAIRAVDPQHDAHHAGGMEYPQVISCGAQFAALPGVPMPEGVTLHEFGHQYFYGLVASDEVEDAFLDEGFNRFAERTALNWFFGEHKFATDFAPWRALGIPAVPLAAPPGRLGHFANVGSGALLGGAPGRPARFWFDAVPLTYDRVGWTFPWIERREWQAVAGDDRVRRAAWTFTDRAHYRGSTYSLTPLTLESYRRAAGSSALYRALRRYVQRFWQQGHPSPDDFIEAVVSVAAEQRAAGLSETGLLPAPLDPRAYFDQVWSTAGSIDFEAVSLDCSREPPPEPTAQASGTDGPWNCAAQVARHGPWVLPVEIELVDETGRSETVVWNGEGGMIKLVRQGDAALVTLRVDPQRRWVFDTNLVNNQLTTQPRRASLWRLWLSAFHLLAERLLSLGRIA